MSKDEEWYYSKSGVQAGPVSEQELQAKVANGEVLGTDMAWCEAMLDWKPVCQCPELMDVAVSPVQSATQAPVPPPPPAGTATPKSCGLATASLICGVVGVSGTCLCFVPGAAGIAAVICGHMALKEIERSEGRLEGRGLAIAGLITGYLAILMMILYALSMGFTSINHRGFYFEYHNQQPKPSPHLMPIDCQQY